MSKARLVITAIEVEGRTPAEVIAAYGVARSWLHELVARYRAEGDAAFEPRSRRPRTSPNATPPRTVELVLRLRLRLSESGLDAGADTIGWHLAHHTGSRCPAPRSTGSWSGTAPSSPPRPSGRSPPISRFAAEQPNETWQSDFTHYRLSRPRRPGPDCEIIGWLDDHSRYALHLYRPRPDHRPDRADTFPPPRPARLSGLNPDRQRHGLHHPLRRRPRRTNRPGTELRRLGIVQKNSRPGPPHHLRQGRTIPADHQAMASRPTPSCHHRRPPDTEPSRV